MRWILSLVGFYALFIMGLFFYQDRLVYFPTHDVSTPASAGAIDFTEIDYPTADGLTLRAWYRPPPVTQDKPAPVMVIFHGNGDIIRNWAKRANQYAALGIGVMLVEYRGYGQNPGKPGERNFIRDSEAAIAWLKTQKITPENIILYGHSLGTGVATALAALYPVRALFLESPFASAVDIAAVRFPLVPVRWLMRDRFLSIDRIKLVKAPITIVHGDQDIVVPLAQGQKLAAAATAPVKFHIIPGGGHIDLYEKGAFALFKNSLDDVMTIKP